MHTQLFYPNFTVEYRPLYLAQTRTFIPRFVKRVETDMYTLAAVYTVKLRSAKIITANKLT